MTDAHTGARTGAETGYGTSRPAREPARALPPGRYGRRATRRTSRWAMPLLVTLALFAGLAVSLSAYRNLRGPGVSGTVAAFTTAEDHVDIRLEVVRDRPHEPAICTLRARSRQGAEVGHAEVAVKPGAGTVVLDYRLATTGRPVTGEVVGCRYGASG